MRRPERVGRYTYGGLPAVALAKAGAEPPKRRSDFGEGRGESLTNFVYMLQ